MLKTQNYKYSKGFTLTKATRTERGFTLMNRASERSERGFTLIELLVVISIMGILLALSVFGMQEARRASRDSKRKADIEQIRSALEMYKADCGVYPTTNIISTGAITGACPTSNTYLSPVPQDPISGTHSYAYTSTGNTYTLCASLEQAPTPSMDTSGCGSCVATCNYQTKSP